MQSQVKSRIQKMYEGYIKNFDKETGKVLNRNIE